MLCTLKTAAGARHANAERALKRFAPLIDRFAIQGAGTEKTDVGAAISQTYCIVGEMATATPTKHAA